jgi:membrane protein implicated in regulation of membrane protease activity
MRLTVRAVPLSQREYAFLAARYRALRHAGVPLVTFALAAGTVVATAVVIGAIFLALGAPWWLAGVFALIASAIPPIVTRREERRRLEEPHGLGEAA